VSATGPHRTFADGGSGAVLVLSRLIAFACLSGALALAMGHNVAPGVAVFAVPVVAAVVARWPGWWPGLLAALLPLASAAPWTGDWLTDESDLLWLAVAAGAWWRLGPGVRVTRAGSVWWLLLALSGAIGLLRGWGDAAVFHGLQSADVTEPPWSWNEARYAGHESAWNAVRVSKAWLALLLLLPVWPADRGAAARRFAWGLLAGLALVGAVVLAERAATVGWQNLALPYRATALFWEMHVGGGAIDMYLALTLPLTLWAVWRARTPVGLAMSLLLLGLAVHAVLATFSRGIVAVALLVLLFMPLAALRWRLPVPVARRPLQLLASAGLCMVLLVWALARSDSWDDRLGRAQADMLGRWQHWMSALQVWRTPGEVLLGVGAGRLPARLVASGEGYEWPGTARLVGGSAGVLLGGPASREDLTGRWTLSQRVGGLPQGSLRWAVRVAPGTDPAAVLWISVCERWLLGALRCADGPVAPARADEDGWIQGTLVLREPFGAGWRAPLVSAGLQSDRVGREARVLEVRLWDAQGRQRFRNPDFASGLAHWMPVAESYYQPWHADNLAVELLVERGVLGLLLVAVVLWLAMRTALQQARRGDPLAWGYLGVLGACCVLGTLISVTEFPRIALLLAFTALAASTNCGEVGNRS
jgi:hypothetical protein